MGSGGGCLEGLNKEPPADRLVEVLPATLQEAEHFWGKVGEPPTQTDHRSKGTVGPESQAGLYVSSCVAWVEALNLSGRWCPHL